jgi:hypothetical protein
MRASRREGPAGASHLYATLRDHEAHAPTYFLCTPDERAFTRLVRQFGGQRSAPPTPAQIQEIQKDGESETSAPEVDTIGC